MRKDLYKTAACNLIYKPWWLLQHSQYDSSRFAAWSRRVARRRPHGEGERGLTRNYNLTQFWQTCGPSECSVQWRNISEQILREQQ